MPRASRRETILELGTRLLAEQGCAATTLSQIADEIGITEPGVYYWVTSKEQLIVDVVAPFLDAVDALLDDPPAETLEMLHGYADVVDRHRDLARLVDQDLIELRRIEVLAIRIDEQTERLRSAVAAGSSPDAESLASAVIGAIRRPLTVLDEPLSPIRRRRLVTAIHDALLH